MRPARAADLHEVATWIRSAEEARLWAGHRVSFPIATDSLALDVEFATASSWVLDAADTICAFGQVVPKPGHRRHLARLIVDPARRRAGYGRVLAEHLVGVALDLGADRVSLNVDASNRAALDLYRSLGFSEAQRPDDEPASASRYLERAR